MSIEATGGWCAPSFAEIGLNDDGSPMPLPPILNAVPVDLPTFVVTRGTRSGDGTWKYCACGHFWLQHDIEEYRGDGSETCCVEGCNQVGCPGRMASQ